jgi:FixJ family two-component response regulator/glycine cleavage system H lipoate-binding protein
MSADARLLVVDDEEVVCRSCSRIFERVGFTVETSTNPREGLRMAVAKDYSAILLDIIMPDLSGIEFLRQLRNVRPHVPVIVITGHSSVTSAAEAMRLRAVDYIPKPFTPAEITEAVWRVVTRPTLAKDPVPEALAAAAGPEAPRVPEVPGVPEAPEVPVEEPPPPPLTKLAGAVVSFEGNAWMRLEEEATVRAGAFLSSDEAAGVEAVRVADNGDTVLRGLPLAEVALQGGRRLVIPAPLSGEIIEVNRELLEAPTDAFRDPCETGWLARVRPTAKTVDLPASATRRVFLTSRDETETRRVRHRLEHLGCAVQIFKDGEAVRTALHQAPGAVVMIDADSMGQAGVDLVRGVGTAAPKTNVVVLASNGASYQMAYRTERVFYYAVTPVADSEVIDILHSAFREASRPACRRRETSALEPSLRAIRVRNRQGESVALLTSGKLLYADHGLGGTIVEHLLAGSYPVETTVGTGDLGMNDISHAIEANDRVLILWSHNTTRIPGSLVRRPLFIERKPAPAPTHAMTLVVQPSADGGEPLSFEPRLSEALAAAIVEEMTARG